MPQETATGNRDIVAVGASAGGVEAVRRLAVCLPADLPAAVLVVIHRGPGAPSLLADILGAAGPLPAQLAEERTRITPGRIYVAPPDRHLLVGPDHLHVRRGPRENRTRPAIDPLFRSAAVHCSSRVIGVLLSGMLDDGTSGLLAIRRCGGVTLVQDPADALYPGMPQSAIASGAADHVVRLAELGPRIAALTREPRPSAVEPPERLRVEALIAAQELLMDPDDMNRLGKLAPFTCPECHGALYEIREDGLVRFRCHTGHAYTAEAMREALAECWEQALYNALRVQEEQHALALRLAEEARARRAERHARDFEVRARSYEEGAETIRALLAAGQRNGDGAASADR